MSSTETMPAKTKSKKPRRGEQSPEWEHRRSSEVKEPLSAIEELVEQFQNSTDAVPGIELSEKIFIFLDVFSREDVCWRHLGAVRPAHELAECLVTLAADDSVDLNNVSLPEGIYGPLKMIRERITNLEDYDPDVEMFETLIGEAGNKETPIPLDQLQRMTGLSRETIRLWKSNRELIDNTQWRGPQKAKLIAEHRATIEAENTQSHVIRPLVDQLKGFGLGSSANE